MFDWKGKCSGLRCRYTFIIWETRRQNIILNI